MYSGERYQIAFCDRLYEKMVDIKCEYNVSGLIGQK